MNFRVVFSFLLLIIGVGYVSFLGVLNYNKMQLKERSERLKKYVRTHISRSLIENKKLSPKLDFEDSKYSVSYTLDLDLQEELEKLLKRYPSDYTSVVVVDNNTGAILAAAGVKKKGREIGYALPFSSTHPSASLFKLITSADLLENNDLYPDKIYSYRGRGTTLYKYQLKDSVSRWTREMTLKRAFALSNNVIFGKAAIRDSSAQSIFKMATKFGFNKSLMEDFDLGVSRISMPDTQYNLAELASGFNRDTQVSPVHAALMAQVIANKGIMKKPFLVDSISGEGTLYSPKKKETRVISVDTAIDLKSMMEEVVAKGTAKRIIRGRVGRKLKKKFVLGAKTGSITGGLPYGKRDWLTLFAQPKEGDSKGISVSIMNINKKRWYYKSTFIARELLNRYMKLNDEKKNAKIDGIEISYKSRNGQR